jgi:predicted HTH domain antitoxin
LEAIRVGTKTLKIPYPDDLPRTLGTTTKEFEQEIRFLVAAKIYEMGHISSGRAAELAGLERVSFLENLSRYRISVFNYSLEELDREILESKDRVEKAT